jgi:MFS family permease
MVSADTNEHPETAPAATPFAADHSPAYRRYILVLLLCVSTLNFLDRQIINILVEPIKLDLNLSDGQLGALTGLSFAVFYAVLGLPIARLADRANRPLIIGVSLIAWSAFTALCGMAGSFVQLLLARIGVGCGEAGGGPPSHSLIADLTPPEKRASALAFFSLGSPLGALIGLAAGAIVADAFGWRMAFVLAAVPGIVIGLILILTVKEPRKMRPKAMTPAISLREALGELRGKKTFWWICAAGATTSVATYGQGAFWGSFFLRVHGAEIATIGTSFGVTPLVLVGVLLGLVTGVSGLFGTLTGGLLTDRLVRHDMRHFATVPGVALLLASPAFLAVIFAPGFGSAALMLIVPVFLSALIFGPSFGVVQTLVRPGTRATAAAILIFLLTLTGLGLGPLAIGLASDAFARTMGSAEGLRWALALTAPFNLVAGTCFLMARRTLIRELVLD